MRIKKTRRGWLHLSEPPFGKSLSVQQLARETYVTEQTVTRWLRAGEIPPAVAELVRVKLLGLLPFPGWVGWRVDDEGQLWSPADHDFSASLIEAGWIVRQAQQTAAREADELRTQLAAIRESFTSSLRFTIYGECVGIEGDAPSNALGALLHELFDAERARHYMMLIAQVHQEARGITRLLTLSECQEYALAVPAADCDGKPTALLLVDGLALSDAGAGVGHGPRPSGRRTS